MMPWKNFNYKGKKLRIDSKQETYRNKLQVQYKKRTSSIQKFIIFSSVTNKAFFLTEARKQRPAL